MFNDSKNSVTPLYCSYCCSLPRSVFDNNAELDSFTSVNQLCMRRTTTLHNLGVRDVRQLALFCSENPSLCLGIMKISSPFLVSSAMMTIVLITAAATIAIILLASNFAIANAQQPLEQQQQQEQQLEESDGGGLTAILNGDRQPAAIQSTTLFQSANDGFSIEVPQGWIIHDLNNSGSALSEEGTQGYGVLAQLCPEEEEEQQQGSAATLPNAGGDTLSCERSENYVIHIIRYHDLDNRLPAANNVTTTSSNNNNSIMTND